MSDLPPEDRAAMEAHRQRKAEARAWAEEKGRMYREYMTTSVVGLEVGVSIALASLIGWYGDRQWGTAPWLMLFGLAIGLTHAGRILYATAKKAMVDDVDEDDSSGHNVQASGDPAAPPSKPSSQEQP
jgi:F0F1-type ATP synthase assembly protein I